MIGSDTYQIRKEGVPTRVKGKPVNGAVVETSFEASIQPASSKETAEHLKGGEVDYEVYKGYTREDVRGVRKHLGIPADQIFYDGSWWKVIKSNRFLRPNDPANSHTKFFMVREA